MVKLDERLERDAETLAVIQNGAVVIRDPPRSGIEVETLLELAILPRTAKFCVGIPAPQRPVSASRPVIELQNANIVSGLPQLQCRGHPRKPGAEDKHGGAFRIALQLDRSLVGRVGREAEAGHRVVHCCTA